MKSLNLSRDTQATILLCGSFGKKEAETVKPLNLREYNRLCQWMKDTNMKPSDLLSSNAVRKLIDSHDRSIDSGRLLTLLARGASMALALENWARKGIWVMSRSDSDYPQRLKEKLKKSAPPVIYGVGNSEMLDGGGLAMVGSRNVDKEGLEFTRKIAAKCVQEKIQIVSGGARGVDEASMQASLEEGGTAIGVLSNQLEQAVVAGKYRKWIMEGSLVLVSPYSPKAPFTVGNAMGRNKHIYTLSDWALVISSSVDKGGTWTGANENLKNSWVPLFVRSGPNVPDGNIRLIQLGGKPMSDKAMGEDISILACLQGQGGDTISEKEAPIPKEIAGIKTVDHQKIEETQGELPGSEPKNANGKVNDLFEIVWPHIERELKTAKLPKDLAESFNINQNQMKDWLERALETGSVKKLTRPVRYVAISQKEFWT